MSSGTSVPVMMKGGRSLMRDAIRRRGGGRNRRSVQAPAGYAGGEVLERVAAHQVAEGEDLVVEALEPLGCEVEDERSGQPGAVEVAPGEEDEEQRDQRK